MMPAIIRVAYAVACTFAALALAVGVSHMLLAPDANGERIVSQFDYGVGSVVIGVALIIAIAAVSALRNQKGAGPHAN